MIPELLWLSFRYSWAMDTGRLSLTLCEAVVEEHSQPEEVKRNLNSLKYIKWPNFNYKFYPMCKVFLLIQLKYLK